MATRAGNYPEHPRARTYMFQTIFSKRLQVSLPSSAASAASARERTNQRVPERHGS